MANYRFLNFLLSGLVFSLANADIQELVVYETAQDASRIDPNARHFVFQRNMRDVPTALKSPEAGFSQAQGACTSNGVWAVYAETNYAPYGNFYLLDALTGSDGQGQGPVCVNMSGVGIGSIRPVGNVNLVLPQLSFYDNPSIKWGREFDFIGSRLVLPWTMTFSSYSFSGAQAWRVSDNLFDQVQSPLQWTPVRPTGPWAWWGANRPRMKALPCGRPICLALPRHNEAQLQATKGNALTYKENTRLAVREIRAGCTGAERHTLYPEYDMTAFTQHGFINQSQTPQIQNQPSIRLTVRDPNTGRTGVIDFTGIMMRLLEPVTLLDYTFSGPAANFTLFPYVWSYVDTQCFGERLPKIQLPTPMAGFGTGAGGTC